VWHKFPSATWFSQISVRLLQKSSQREHHEKRPILKKLGEVIRRG
jgi:hypothetical protein